jgi:prolyl 4-hydroxylase
MKQNTYEFVSPFQKEELDALIKKYGDDLPPLRVIGDNEKVVYRVGDGTWIQESNDLNDRLKLIVAGITGLPVENQEATHFVRYGIGGKYDTHHDYFTPAMENYEEHFKRGGNRVYTAILYLNEEFKGGETNFPDLNIKVVPTSGKLFVWRNMLPDRSLYDKSKHAGLPVIEGTKYILVIWVRERKFE